MHTLKILVHNLGRGLRDIPRFWWGLPLWELAWYTFLTNPSLWQQPEALSWVLIILGLMIFVWSLSVANLPYGALDNGALILLAGTLVTIVNVILEEAWYLYYLLSHGALTYFSLHDAQLLLRSEIARSVSHLSIPVVVGLLAVCVFAIYHQLFRKGNQ